MRAWFAGASLAWFVGVSLAEEGLATQGPWAVRGPSVARGSSWRLSDCRSVSL